MGHPICKKDVMGHPICQKDVMGCPSLLESCHGTSQPNCQKAVMGCSRQLESCHGTSHLLEGCHGTSHLPERHHGTAHLPESCHGTSCLNADCSCVFRRGHVFKNLPFWPTACLQTILEGTASAAQILWQGKGHSLSGQGPRFLGCLLSLSYQGFSPAGKQGGYCCGPHALC